MDPVHGLYSDGQGPPAPPALEPGVPLDPPPVEEEPLRPLPELLPEPSRPPRRPRDCFRPLGFAPPEPAPLEREEDCWLGGRDAPVLPVEDVASEDAGLLAAATRAVGAVVSLFAMLSSSMRRSARASRKLGNDGPGEDEGRWW
jgi:hypothetical protein